MSPNLFQLGVWGRCKPPQRGPGQSPGGKRTLANIFLRINLKSGLFSVAVYTPNSDPISDVHWLVRRKIGSAVRGCAKLVDIRICIENDRLVTSLVYCAIYAQLLVFFFRVLHTMFSHLRAHAFALSVTVARSSAVQASSSRRQERRWAIVCGSPQSQSTDWASSR